MEMRPCPFCGGPARKPIMYNGALETGCGGDFRDCAGVDLLVPIAYWNARAPAPHDDIAKLHNVIEEIARGYGVNHTSKWARDFARTALSMTPPNAS